MKLAFSTLPCESWSFEKVLKTCKYNAIDGIELRLGNDEWSDENMPDRYACSIKEKLNEYKVTNIGSDVLVRGYDVEKIWQYEKSLRLAKLFDAKGVRIFLGNFLQNITDEREPVDYDGIVECIRDMADISNHAGVEVWVETHNEFATGHVLKQLMKDVNKSNCKVIWDIIHPIEQNETVDETIKEMWEYVAHFHIKDGKLPHDRNKANWDYTKLGEGSLPISEIVEKAEELGFNGYYSLEWESKWREEINTPDCIGELIIPQFARYMMEIGA